MRIDLRDGASEQIARHLVLTIPDLGGSRFSCGANTGSIILEEERLAIQVRRTPECRGALEELATVLDDALAWVNQGFCPACDEETLKPDETLCGTCRAECDHQAMVEAAAQVFTAAPEGGAR